MKNKNKGNSVLLRSPLMKNKFSEASMVFQVNNDQHLLGHFIRCLAAVICNNDIIIFSCFIFFSEATGSVCGVDGVQVSHQHHKFSPLSG